MTKEERLEWLKCIEKDIYVSSLESTFADDSKSCAIHSIIEELEQEPTTKNYLGVDCISRVEVKKIAKEMYFEVANMELDVNTISDCISYTSSKCREVLERKLQTLPSVTPQETRWVSVTEKLPEEDGGYLVTVKRGYVTTALWVGNTKHWNEVTAWMPLPKPYNEVKK